jgi:hypothetical protein
MNSPKPHRRSARASPASTPRDCIDKHIGAFCGWAPFDYFSFWRRGYVRWSFPPQLDLGLRRPFPAMTCFRCRTPLHCCPKWQHRMARHFRVRRVPLDPTSQWAFGKLLFADFDFVIGWVGKSPTNSGTVPLNN